MNPKIAIVLPPKEQFTDQYAGAVALCMADFTAHSRFRESTRIFGGTKATFGILNYTQIADWKRWYLRDNYAYAIKLLAIIKADRYTHVEIQNRPLIHRYIAKNSPASVAVSLHLHNDPQSMEGLKSLTERQWALDHSAAIYCVSEFIRQKFLAGLTRVLNKVHVVYNGIDTQKQCSVSKEKIILYVGRIIQEKGALPLSEALTMVAAQLPDWQFVICGADRFNILSEYETATHRNLTKLGQQCQYTGYISHREVMHYFARAEIAVIPSVWEEPFGRTVLEAMSGAAAVITSGSGGIKEIVANTSLIVNPVTPAGLAAAISQLSGDSALRITLQQQGHKRAVDAFDIRLIAAQLDDLRDGIYSTTASM